jgi:hypothetical protein
VFQLFLLKFFLVFRAAGRKRYYWWGIGIGNAFDAINTNGGLKIWWYFYREAL